MKKLTYLLFSIMVLSCSTPQRDFKAILEKRAADSIAAIELKKIEEEKLRIEKEKSLGIWRIGHYVDEFGEPTKEGFISTSYLILGKFSNSATENSDLTVKFLISGPDDVNFQMYEYAGTNPVKDGLEYGYKIRVKQDSLPPVELYASNYSDRLSLDKTNSKKLNDMFMKGGNLKFIIIEQSKYSQSKYSFEIPDASGYNNALKQLQEKK